MAGLADLLYLGQPDPARQLAMALAGRQQPQPGPGPAGPAPAGPGPVDPNAPAPNAQPVNAADPNAPAPNPAPGAPPPPGSPPQPQALTSTPDMSASYQTLANPPNIMSLYMQMDARNRASDQINRGLALIAANHSAPSMRQAIMESVGGGQDAGSTVGNLMNIYQMQQGMAANQQLLGQAPDIAAKLGLPLAVVQSRIMAGKGDELVQAMEPTPKTRDIQAEHDMFIKNGGSEDDWQKTYLPLIITGGIPGATPDTRTRIRALTQWNSDPANQGKPTPPYLTDDTKWKLYTTDLGDAKTQFSGLNDSLGRFIDQMGDVSNDKGLDGLAGHPISGGLAAMAPTSDAYQLSRKMQGLAGTAKDMASRGGPKGLSQNLKTLGSNPDDFTDLGITDYRGDVIAPRMRQALAAQANAYGASGQINIMPGYLKPYLDQQYQPGGENDPGGGFKPFTPSKDLKQPNASTLNAFRNDVEHRGPKAALANLEAQGFDTSSLK
jgi:hypothetical protein